jgi:hypothetical protein
MIIKFMMCLSLAMLISSGCSKSNKLRFCEGVSPEGDGVNCGKKFEDGELTAVITAGDPFGVNAISVQILEIRENKKPEKIETVTVDVKPDKQMATANLSFYTGGKYIVRAMKNDVLIGESELEIVEK